MKKTNLLACVVVLIAGMVSIVKADVVTVYDAKTKDGVALVNGNYKTEKTWNWGTSSNDLVTTYKGINDSNSETSLFQHFNTLFSLTGDNAYTSSNQLFADRGVNPNQQTWSADSGTWMYSDKDADYVHEMNILKNPQSSETLYTYTDQNVKESYFDLNSLIKINGGDELFDFTWSLDAIDGDKTNSYTSGLFSSDGFVHMLAFDISDLLVAAFPEIGNIGSAYFIAWEDRTNVGDFGDSDWDYNDLMGIYINVWPGGENEKPITWPEGEPEIPIGGDDNGSSTPEPATMLILGLGTLGAGLYGRRRKK